MQKKGVDDTITEILQDREKQSEKAGAREKELGRIREDIREGKKTTGDEIKDFLIAWAWDYQGSKRGEIESLQAKVNSAVGNPLLVVSVLDMQEPDYHISGPGQDEPVPHHLERSYHLRLGVVKDNLRLDVKKGQAVIPAEKYAERHNRDAFVSEHSEDVDKPNISRDRKERKWELANRNIVLSSTEIVSEAMPSDLSMNVLISLARIGERGGTPMHRTHLYAGDEIDEFFTYKPRFREGEELDLSYVNALGLLGLKVPDKFQQGNARFLDTRRVEIYSNLDSLVTMEMAAARDVNETEKRAGELQGTRNENWSEDEHKIWSKWYHGVGLVKNSRAKIAEHLREIVELGLHESPRVIELVPGKSIDFQRYFSGVLRNYPLDKV